MAKGSVVAAKGSQTPAAGDKPLVGLGTKALLAGGAALLGGGMLASGVAGQVLSRPGASSYGGGYQGNRNLSQYGYPTY